jgi:hypothetical protein
MRAFAELLDRLYFTHGNLAKRAILHDYFRLTPWHCARRSRAADGQAKSPGFMGAGLC